MLVDSCFLHEVQFRPDNWTVTVQNTVGVVLTSGSKTGKSLDPRSESLGSAAGQPSSLALNKAQQRCVQPSSFDICRCVLAGSSIRRIPRLANTVLDLRYIALICICQRPDQIRRVE